VSRKHRCLMLGAGGMAGNWIRRFLAAFPERVEIVGLVDVRPEALAASGDFLGLPPARRFGAMAEAFERVDADFCAIVIPPAFHQEAVMRAVRRRLPILSEKPIADTWQASVEIYRAVTAAGVPMQVVQNYRYDRPMLTMRGVLRDGILGRLNSLVARFAADYREYGSWGAPFRHEIPHALLVEGGVHHFDMLRNLSGGDCRLLAGWEWNPPWSTSKGAFCNAYVMTMANDTRAMYEGSGTAAGEQHSWHDEYYRAECEEGAVSVGRDDVVRIARHRPGRGLTIEEVPPVRVEHEGHLWIVREFLDWLDGGPTPTTVVRDNLRTTAMVFGAIEASRTNQVVDVAAMVDEAEQAAGASAG
jgi:predicted dehydrogenase